MTAAAAFTLGDLAARLGLPLEGNPALVITGIATLANAGSGQISFYHNKRYYPDLLVTKASAVIIHPDQATFCPVAKLLSLNPYLSYAVASRFFGRETSVLPGIHATTIVHPSAKIAAGASLGAHVCVGANTVIANDVHIGPNSVIGENCSIGTGSHLSANITLYHGVTVGCRVRIHSGAVLGSDGFGFAQDGQRHEKIAQLGGVRVGDDVEIGAGTTIDRGALDDTVIEDGVKIDNQVQIAHNVRIGSNTIICGCSAIAGSSVIGKNCIIAGAAGVINHVSICDGVTVTAMSLVNQSITEPGVYASGTGLDKAGTWKKNIVRFRQLDEIWKKLLRLEK